VASKHFFLRTVPLFDGGDDVAMVLSPQCFHNLNMHTDIFNHSNIHFWEYAQHGYDAIGFISCTGAAPARSPRRPLCHPAGGAG
jgi:endoglucanase